MDRIDSMGVFAKVVAKQSFSGAARELRLSQAVVSKHVRALEDWLGAQLLNRTTRRLNVTEIGALVYERCERILDEIDEVQQSTNALQTAPRGVLHLAAPVSFGITQLGPALADYLARYPEVMLGGAGIGLTPTFVVGKDLAERRLVPLMPDYQPIGSELSVIYPPGTNLSAKVRTLIDFLAARFGPEPPWDACRESRSKSGTNSGEGR